MCVCVAAEEHRELVRKCLRLLVAEGYRPMHFYQHDLQKYYYLGELMALVDLSLVSPHLWHSPAVLQLTADLT